MNFGGNLLAVFYSKVKEPQQSAYKTIEFISTREGFESRSQRATSTSPVRHAAEGRQRGGAGPDGRRAHQPGDLAGSGRGLEALTVHIDWITRIVNGAVSVPDGLRSRPRRPLEKLIAA